jgi:hypothetical protein
MINTTCCIYSNCLHSVLTHAAPVWSNTSSSNYRRLQILQSKFLRVIGNYPRRTPILRLHTALTLILLTWRIWWAPNNASRWQVGFYLAFKWLNVAPIRDFIYHLTDNFFGSCSAHPNPLGRSIGNYTLADFHHQYKKYIYKRPKHILL